MNTTLTGWELDRVNSSILDNKMKQVQLLLQNYPLCAWDITESTFWIIRKYHPILQQQPDNETDFRYGLLYHLPSGCCLYFLPHLTYTKLSISERNQYFKIIITSNEFGDITTNKNELGRKLLYNIHTDEERVLAFRNLCDDIIIKKRTSIIEHKVISSVVGIMVQHEFDDLWISKKQTIPYFSGESFHINFVDYIPSEDANFIEDADKLLNAFLSKDNQSRINDLTTPLYQNCINFIEDVYDEDNKIHRDLINLSNEMDIWEQITLQEINIQRDRITNKMTLDIYFDCTWDDEHGVNILYDESANFLSII